MADVRGGGALFHVNAKAHDSHDSNESILGRTGLVKTQKDQPRLGLWCTTVLHNAMVLAHARDNYHGACLRGLDNQPVSTPAEQARKLFCCLTQCTEHVPATLAEHCCAEEFNLPSQLAGRWRGCESDNLGSVTTCYNSRLYSSGRLLALISCRQLMDGNCVNS